MVVQKKQRAPIDHQALSAIGARLRRAREDAGLTANEVATRRDRTTQWLTEIERGNSNVTLYDAVWLAKIYATPLESFVMPGVNPSAFRVPVTMADWKAMYPSQPKRASAHYSLDSLFEDGAAGRLDE